MKRFLKGISLVLIAAILATGIITIGNVGNNRVKAAAGAYKLLSGANVNVEYAEWRFADAIPSSAKNHQAKDANGSYTFSGSGDTATHHAVFKDAYLFNGTTYDVNIIIKKSNGVDYNHLVDIPYEDPASVSLLGDSDRTALTYPDSSQAPSGDNLVISNRTDFNFITLRMGTEKNKTFDYEIYLTKDGNTVEYSKAPIVVGQVFNANRFYANDAKNSANQSAEKNRIYSNEGKLYTNYSTGPSVEDDYDKTVLRDHITFYSGGNINGYIMAKGGSGGSNTYDTPGIYMCGLGSDGNKVYGGYSSIQGADACELRIGYKAYSIEYVAASGAQVASKPSEELVPAPIGSNTYSPTKDNVIGTDITATTGNIITKLTVDKIYVGENKGVVANNKNEVTLSNGKKLKVGQIITPEEIKLLPMEYNLVIAIHTKADSDTNVDLIYNRNNDNINSPKILDIQTDAPNNTRTLSSNVPTEWVKNAVINGLDGKRYRFDGWYNNPDGSGGEFVFGTDIVETTNKNIYAKWTEVKPSGGYYTPSSVTLSFDTNGNDGYTKPDSQSGSSGFTGKVPADIKVGDIIDGYQFTGWFKDKDGKEPFDFKTGISTNTTAYAGWEKVDENTTPDSENPVVKVEFETEIGVPPATQVETPGNTAEDPGAPMDINTLKPGTVINGYRFEGWYLDKEYKLKYDFSTPVTEDIILYAKWTAVGSSKSPKTGEPIIPYVGILGFGVLGITMCGLSMFRRRKED